MSFQDEYASFFDGLGAANTIYYKFFKLFSIQDQVSMPVDLAMNVSKTLRFSQWTLLTFNEEDPDVWHSFIKDQKKIATSKSIQEPLELRRRLWFFVQKLHEARDTLSLPAMKHVIYWMDIAMEQLREPSDDAR